MANWRLREDYLRRTAYKRLTCHACGLPVTQREASRNFICDAKGSRHFHQICMPPREPVVIADHEKRQTVDEAWEAYTRGVSPGLARILTKDVEPHKPVSNADALGDADDAEYVLGSIESGIVW